MTRLVKPAPRGTDSAAGPCGNGANDESGEGELSETT
ncbi:hypothetical protein AGROH133_09451 [Agrobacterium tumefaciens]|nr:hypothetical protein AGROH133_09451 [Agrobacterium tumefaciens]